MAVRAHAPGLSPYSDAHHADVYEEALHRPGACPRLCGSRQRPGRRRLAGSSRAGVASRNRVQRGWELGRWPCSADASPPVAQGWRSSGQSGRAPAGLSCMAALRIEGGGGRFNPEPATLCRSRTWAYAHYQSLDKATSWWMKGSSRYARSSELVEGMSWRNRVISFPAQMVRQAHQ